MTKKIIHLLLITFFIGVITPSCGKITIPKSIIPSSVVKITSGTGQALGDVAKSTGGFLKMIFDFFRIKKSSPGDGKEADVTSFVIDTIEETVEDIIENIIDGDGPLELVGDVVENVIEEAQEHLLK